MSSTTQVTTFSDLYTDLMNRIRADTAASATLIQAKRYTNIALYDMILGFEYKMPWLEREAVIVTSAPYTTGTVTIAQGSSALTGAGTLWATANVFGNNNARTTGRLNIGGGSDIYRLSAVNSD